MNSIENGIEQNEKPKKVFCIGGFLSGATFPWGTSTHSTFDSIRNNKAIEIREYSLNNQVLTAFDMISLPFLYHKTRQESISLEKLRELQEQLKSFNPDFIAGHSLGCYVLDIYHKLGFVIPSCVKETRYYQADLETISNPNVINYYSPFDPVLYAAKIANLRTRDAGMYGDPNHSKNIKLHPNILSRHTGIPLIDWHLDSANKFEI